MKELVDPAVVEKVMLYLAVAGPLVGLTCGIAVGWRTRRVLPATVGGTLVGLLCPAAFGMWRLYGAVTDALGLDSVVNLVVQLALFAVSGCILGVAAYGLNTLFRGVQPRNQ